MPKGVSKGASLLRGIQAMASTGKAHLEEPHSCCPTAVTATPEWESTGHSSSRALEDVPPGTARGHWAWDSTAGSCHQNSHLGSVRTPITFQHHQPNFGRFSGDRRRQHSQVPVPQAGNTTAFRWNDRISFFFFFNAGQSNFLSLELLIQLEEVSCLQNFICQ